MTFYLLAFVVVLAIFGLIRSPNARERLHLQSIYTWSSKVILNQLRVCRQQLLELLGVQENIDIFEITDEVDDEPVIEEIERSDSIEEIQGIRLRSNLSDYRITSDAEETDFDRLGSQPIGRQEPEERDKVLAAITASLRRLSSAASSGKMSGVQLYDILLQETLLHDKAMRQESLQQASSAAAASTAPSAPDQEALQREQSPGEEATAQKARMYFGQSPLEYTPHQK